MYPTPNTLLSIAGSKLLIKVSFCGYTVLNWFERLAWIPILVVYIAALGVGGKNLSNPPPAEPASAATVLSFASTMAGFVITWAPLGSDYTLYFKPQVSRYVLDRSFFII
jgi:purine-cytosine permease-like protein